VDDITRVLAYHDPLEIVGDNPQGATEYNMEASEIARRLLRAGDPIRGASSIVYDVLSQNFDEESLPRRMDLEVTTNAIADAYRRRVRA
jgi:hypothetical protein